MMRSLKLTPRQILIVLHDLLATAAAIVVTFFMRFEGAALNERLHALVLFLPCFLAYALIVYFIVGLQRNKWRFTSVPDLYNLFRASTVLAVSLLALDYVFDITEFLRHVLFSQNHHSALLVPADVFLGGLAVVTATCTIGERSSASGLQTRLLPWFSGVPPTRKFYYAGSKAVPLKKYGLLGFCRHRPPIEANRSGVFRYWAISTTLNGLWPIWRRVATA
jgi:hypothetical protein